MGDRRESWSRREFVGGLTLVGTAGLLGVRPETAGAEAPPETTLLRVAQSPAICFAPKYVAADQLFQAEGFAEVKYVKSRGAAHEPLISGEADIAANDAPTFIVSIDKGQPIVLLMGLHLGCYELFGSDRVRSVRDLTGKKIAVMWLNSAGHLMLSIMLAHVGIDPRKDVQWVTYPAGEAMQLLAEGKVDAYIGFPPEPQELRARKIGRVLVSTTLDRPWSGYFCCFVAARRDFVVKHPVATKRALRAIVKAASVCALEPERAARFLVDRGFTEGYESAVQTLKELPYRKWREYEPADGLRFYALRLHEVGMIKSSPHKILAQGTDWRFLNELKKELKG